MKSKKILSIILSVIMVLSALPFAGITAFAAEPTITYDSATQTVTFSTTEQVYQAQIKALKETYPDYKHIIIKEATYGFYYSAFASDCIAETITIPSNLTSLPSTVFANCEKLKTMEIQ